LALGFQFGELLRDGSLPVGVMNEHRLEGAELGGCAGEPLLGEVGAGGQVAGVGAGAVQP